MQRRVTILIRGGEETSVLASEIHALLESLKLPVYSTGLVARTSDEHEKALETLRSDPPRVELRVQHQVDTTWLVDSSVDDLNTQVTAAIVLAEWAVEDAEGQWGRVQLIESALAEKESDESLRNTARRGEALARKKQQVLDDLDEVAASYTP